MRHRRWHVSCLGPEGVKDKLARLQASGVGRFAAKFSADRGTSLAVLLAWGTLNTLFPLILGVTALAGLVLQDEQRLRDLNQALVQLLPSDVAQPLSEVLDATRKSAAVLGAVGLLLLLWNGSGFFANMESVFNQAYRVADRGFVAQRLIALVMMVIVTVLMLVSTAAYSVGNLLASATDFLFRLVPGGVPGAGGVGLLIGSAVSVLTAIVMFSVLYKVLPNKAQGWKQVLPGSLLAGALFFLLLQLFPLYLAFFGQSFQAYALFGVFLLMMFWSYLLGIVLVLGAELNAFLEAPELADAAIAQRRPLGAFEVDTMGRREGPLPARPAAVDRHRAGFGGHVVGVLGVLVALLLNRRSKQGRPRVSSGA